jgi:hypothetical protein
MLLTVRHAGLALLTVLPFVVAFGGPTRVVGQSPAPRVTSDTPEYCLELLDRVSELVRLADAPPPQDVTRLSSEGQKMCDQGQTRGGILRLRRALMLMMHPDIDAAH